MAVESMVLGRGSTQLRPSPTPGARVTGDTHQYPTFIYVKPAVESPPGLHGTVAQDRLGDRPRHDDVSQSRVRDGVETLKVS